MNSILQPYEIDLNFDPTAFRTTGAVNQDVVEDVFADTDVGSEDGDGDRTRLHVIEEGLLYEWIKGRSLASWFYFRGEHIIPCLNPS